MAQQGQMIVKMPNGAIEVKARRRLTGEGTFEAFVEEIQNRLIQLKESDANATVSDFDISQNPMTADQFEILFNALALAGVKVLRFRLFGCPGLNDEAMRHIAEHFSQDLNTQTAPAEMHLSDCAITTDGFLQLMGVLEEKELYPTTIIHPRGQPLYLRLENNFIDEAVIQEKVDAGIIRGLKKGPGMSSQHVADPNIKVNLVCRAEGSYQQKTGEPPAPEDAPPPKPVHDNNSWNQKGGGGKWSQQARPQWQNSPGGWRPAAAQALPGKGKWQPRPAGAVHNPMAARPYYGGVVKPIRPGQWQPQQQAWQRGNAGTAADRSRTPAARVNNAGTGPAPPAGKPPKKGDLPHPWEEQWSEEYQIPYFWNSETGEALWERPTA